MNKFLRSSIALGAGLFLMAGAQAATLQLNFDYDFSDPLDPNSGSPDGAGPWATAVFDDGGSAGSVTLTISNFANEITGLWFNLDSSLDASLLTIAAAGGTGPTANNIYQGTGVQLQADGSGYYDIAFDLPPPGSDRFDAGETLIYTITGAGLTASSFNFISVNETTTGPYLAAAKFASTGIDGEQSAWVAAVPVPAAVWLFGSALGMLVWSRRRAA